MKERLIGLAAAAPLLASSFQGGFPLENNSVVNQLDARSKTERALEAIGTTYLDRTFIREHPGEFGKNHKLLYPDQIMILPEDTPFYSTKIIVPTIGLDESIVNVDLIDDPSGGKTWPVPDEGVSSPLPNPFIDNDNSIRWGHTISPTDGTFHRISELNLEEPIISQGTLSTGEQLQRTFEINEFIVTTKENAQILYENVDASSAQVILQSCVMVNGQWLVPPENFLNKATVLADVTVSHDVLLLFVKGEMVEQVFIETGSQVQLP